MSEASELLAQLRTVREPLPPESTELWLIVANVGLLVLILFMGWIRYTARNRKWKKRFLHDLNQAKELPQEQAVCNVAIMLRQLMLSRGHNVNTLTGNAWLEQLDNEFNTTFFTQSRGRVFGNALYQPVVAGKSHTIDVINEIDRLVRLLPETRQTPVTPS